MTEFLKDPRVLRGHTFLLYKDVVWKLMGRNTPWDHRTGHLTVFNLEVNTVHAARYRAPAFSFPLIKGWLNCGVTSLQNCQGRREVANVLLSPGSSDK